ncbi:coproporphyrinogen-III oxidase family protein [Pelobacter propionicus]|uniref:Coproporphyrinogen III oxidase, anaerobic n=1 Tax=Pelobacter propionicus (strain DSM 2379 / NBRC 103807 / OttBd1) TaxID=338966 RepID=A1ARW5_PELPD|nr:radical SAM protein [Pelobacter propionicus]ABL00086.1 coproporphyrinogen III oxidase, anaerobic [Pelobacter propionicus DSM 2379]
MQRNAALDRIRNELFYGSCNYTKSQPDLFVPQHFTMLAPSKASSFIDTVVAAMVETELLLYIHLPFCFSECLFCNSFPHKVDTQVQQEYLRRLILQIELYERLGLFKGKKAKCICFGGGTPTAFANSEIRKVMDTVRACVTLTDDCSIATEAHPATMEHEARVLDLADMGFNRISMGCQTFDPQILQLCNRNNTPSQVQGIVQTVQRAGMMINIDMMTGLPGQSIESVQADLRMLEQIRPDAVEYIRHEIVNPLIARLYTQRPELIVPDDTLFDMVFMAQEWMDGQGYEQNGRFSCDRQWPYRYHWLRETPIISFGIRTRSYSPAICFDSHEELASFNRLVDKGIPPVGRYIMLSRRERMYRRLILSLQLKGGLDISRFHASFGESPLDVFSPLVSKLADLGCLCQEDESLRLTRLGAYFVEDVCDCIIDSALQEESRGLVRAPHSGGSMFRR